MGHVTVSWNGVVDCSQQIIPITNTTKDIVEAILRVVEAQKGRVEH